jgi:hypothetical protein
MNEHSDRYLELSLSEQKKIDSILKQLKGFVSVPQVRQLQVRKI